MNVVAICVRASVCVLVEEKQMKTKSIQMATVLELVVYTLIQYAVLSVATFGSTNYKMNSVVVVATKRLDAIIESIQFSKSTYEKHVTHPYTTTHDT